MITYLMFINEVYFDFNKGNFWWNGDLLTCKKDFFNFLSLIDFRFKKIFNYNNNTWIELEIDLYGRH